MNGLALPPGRVLRGLSLCSGVGVLDLGVKLACPTYRAVCYVEREAFAASRLVARMADAALDDAPVWDDLVAFDGRPWRGAVDIVVAGFPCQPVSAAGKRRATEDDRWLWPDIARIVGEVGPELVYLENVPGLLTRGGAAVVGSLAALGFDAEWMPLSAAAVGAAHERERLWILAYAGQQRRARGAGREQIAGRGVPTSARPAGQELADADVCGQQPGQRSLPPRADEPDATRSRALGVGQAHPERDGLALLGQPPGEWLRPDPDGRGGAQPLGDPGRERRGARAVGAVSGSAELSRACVAGHASPGERMGDTHGDGRDEGRAEPEARGRSADAVVACDDSIPLFAPGRSALDEWRRILAVAPGLEPAVRRDADGLADRLDRIHAVGNGVVPLAAAVALCVLATRLGVRELMGIVS